MGTADGRLEMMGFEKLDLHVAGLPHSNQICVVPTNLET